MIDEFAYIPEIGFGIFNNPIQLLTEHILIHVDSYNFERDSDGLFSFFLTSDNKTYIYRTYNAEIIKDIPPYFESASFEVVKDTLYICSTINVNAS